MDAYEIYARIGEKKPLVHHITNWVTIYDCANMTRTFGALPVMAHAREEVEEMVGLAGALVLNIGTLTTELVDTMILAGKAANTRGIPVILDAVGAGATKLRTISTQRILENVKVSILKGNYGEIGVIAGSEAEVKGVESISLEGDPVELAKSLSIALDNTVVMTGKRDIVAREDKALLIDNGHDIMGTVVGTGCMAASVLGAFAAVEEDHAKAAAAALACYGIIGELAAEGAVGPNSFKGNFYDSVGRLTKDIVDDKARITEA